MKKKTAGPAAPGLLFYGKFSGETPIITQK